LQPLDLFGSRIFAIEFDSKGGHKLVEDWRPLDAEDAVLSACSSLLSIVDVKSSKVVQFSHFSVKEFLASDRLASSYARTLSQYHVPLEPAHAFLGWACLVVLLPLDAKTDEKRFRTFPLAFYSAEHWVDHARFGKPTPEIEDATICLFDPKKSHLAAWAWMHDIELGYSKLIHQPQGQPPRSSATALYFVAYCGFGWLAKHLIIRHSKDINARWDRDRAYRTPLHAAYHGHRAAARVLYADEAEVKREPEDEPLIARHDGHLEVMQLLLEHGAQVDARDSHRDAVSYRAAKHGDAEVLQLLLVQDRYQSQRKPGQDAIAQCIVLWPCQGRAAPSRVQS
jgi:Ankyrin repeats (many copies)